MTIDEAILEMTQLEPLSIPAVQNGAIWVRLDDLIRILMQIDGANAVPLAEKYIEFLRKYDTSLRYYL